MRQSRRSPSCPGPEKPIRDVLSRAEDVLSRVEIDRLEGVMANERDKLVTDAPTFGASALVDRDAPNC